MNSSVVALRSENRRPPPPEFIIGPAVGRTSWRGRAFPEKAGLFRYSEKARKKRAIFGTHGRNDRSHEETAGSVLCEPGGGIPVREWLLELTDADRRTIGKDIQKVEFGWPIGRPHCAPLSHGLWEVRSDLDRNMIARVIFCIDGGQMILLHGFIKKTQKVAQSDIELARKRKREVTS
jgi:phage-related protein